MYINCKGQLLDFDIPKIMGILNITPDSFYDGGRRKNVEAHLQQAEKMLREGADIIDVGAYSSRANGKEISAKEELSRLLPVIEAILKKYPETILSVDTFRSEVAEEAIRAGAAIINDISGGSFDVAMMETAADLQVPFIIMHLRGDNANMHAAYQYQDLVQEIIFYFSEKIDRARSLGINDLIIDPGFGFSKNRTQNFELLNQLKLLEILELPILSAVSRKSMIYKTLEITPEEALNGTTVLNTISLLNGANILRVHDVKEAVDCVKLVNRLKN